MKFKAAIVLLMIFLLPVLAQSQNSKCESKLDSNAVKKIAKRKRIYWTSAWQCPPYTKLDTLNCKWVFYSCKIKHSDKGDCKHTNGCTVITTALLEIDAKTKKILKFKKEEHWTHNYE